MSKRVVILGATGSIGSQTLDVIRARPDDFEVVGLAARADAPGLAKAASDFGVHDLALFDATAAEDLRQRMPDAQVRDGLLGVSEVAAIEADLVVNGITGAVGLEPTLAALGAGTRVALANKESLIVGGDLVVNAASKVGISDVLIPVDSEHSAVAQCLRAGARDEVAKVTLTASGGPFRGRSLSELAGVTVEQALAHPTWDMGSVITINSATLMNKGLELIEAHYLFDLPWDRLDAIVHPESIVHSLVEFVDGSTVAQLSPPDMRLPIQLALSWPDRLDHAFASLDLVALRSLTFEPVDRSTFKAVELAEHAGRKRGTYPAVLNAANEQAVAAFLENRLPFVEIAEVVATVLLAHDGGTPSVVKDVLQADRQARRHADEVIRERGE